MPQSPTVVPDSTGHFGPYGGVFVPETLMAALRQLEAEYARAKSDPKFQRELDEHQTGFAFGEVLAHVNHMLGRDQLVLETGGDAIDRYRAR